LVSDGFLLFGCRFASQLPDGDERWSATRPCHCKYGFGHPWTLRVSYAVNVSYGNLIRRPKTMIIQFASCRFTLKLCDTGHKDAVAMSRPSAAFYFEGRSREAACESLRNVEKVWQHSARRYLSELIWGLMIWMNQVKQMYSVGSLPDDMRWLVILGDDVYINTARLYYFLAGHASRDDHPVIFAHASRRQSLAASESEPWTSRSI
jgi:hypothetical protein